MIAEHIFYSNIFSVVWDNNFRICIQIPLLMSKKSAVLFHTLLGYSSWLVRYKIYSSYPRECFCTSWRNAEAYENFSIDQAPCRNNPMKNKIVIPNCHPLLPAENHTKIKAWQLKFAWSDHCFYEKLHWYKSVTAEVSLENLVRKVLKENMLWNRWLILKKK